MITRKITRRIKKFSCLILAVIFSCLFVGCKDDKPKVDSQPQENNQVAIEQAKQNLLIANYLSVGTSDSTIIKLPNGKVLMIDTASSSAGNYDKIKATIKSYGASKIDYLILTHPDTAHYGNLSAMLDDYAVDTIYAPYIVEEVFVDFVSVMNKAKEKGSKVKISVYSEKIVDDDISVFFLYPKNYSELVLGLADEIATTEQVDSFSSMIYLEYKGIKFLFSGDCSKKTEKIVLENYKAGVYKNLFSKANLLNEIDYYMLSSHGGSSGNSLEFIETIKPKNAIISVGGDSSYGTPSITVINNLANNDCRVLRTDHEGNITVTVNEKGGTNLKTDKDRNNE